MLTVPTLVKRAVKGLPLTIAEGDQNWQDIMDFLTAINSQVSSAIQDNGILGMYYRDTGVANAYAITPPNYETAYLDGQFYLVKALNTNNGPSTLQVASEANAFLPAVPIRALGADIPSGSINAGQVFAVVYDSVDGVFNLITGTNNPTTIISTDGSSTGTGTATDVTTDQGANLANFNPADVTIPLSQATGLFTGIGAASPANNTTVTLDATVYTFKTVLSTGPTVPNQVLIGAHLVDCLNNLATAVNVGASGTVVSVGTVPHATVTAVVVANGTTNSGNLIVTSKLAGARLPAVGAPLPQLNTSVSVGTWGTWATAYLTNGQARVVLQLPHNLGVVPSGISVGLVCIAAEDNFTVGQVVPADSFFTASNQPGIVYRADNTYLTFSLTNDVLFVPDQVSGVTSNVTLSKWRFHVSAYAIQGLPTFTLQNAAALSGPLSTQQFAHGLVNPTVFVSLVPNTAQFGHGIGELTPIDQFYDVNGNPAFTVMVDATNITIRENCAGGTGPYVVSVTDGTSQLITEINWGLQIFAFATSTPSPITEPAIEVSMANPDGAVSWNNALYACNYGVYANKTYLAQIDLTTNNVTQLQTFGPGNPNALSITQVNPTVMRFGSDNLDRMVFSCTRGIFSCILSNPSAAGSLRSYDTQDASRFKPIWVDESAFSATGIQQSVANPTIYLAASGGNTAGNPYNTKAVGGIKALYNGSSYVHAPSWPVYVGPTPGPLKTPALNLHDPRINNSAAFVNFHSVGAAIVLLFQYNPLKRRIYVVTNECGYLFIFHLRDGTGAGYFAGNNIAAWWDQDDATRYPELEVSKIVAMAGGGGVWANPLRERITVEFDTDTGEEISICYTRLNTINYLGSVIRTPWRE